MSTVALRPHPDRGAADEIAGAIAERLAERGHALADSVEGADLVVAVGGDGTMLRAVDEAARHGVAVLGVNVGHLGYLTEVDRDHWPRALDRWEAGEARVVERMLLSVRVERAESAAEGTDRPEPLVDGSYLGLNEVVVEKTPIGRMVNLAVILDGEPFHTYAADGMIVATPTGSTAYALSARGPIVDPSHRALLLAPVSPHSLFDRSLVLSPDTEVRLVVRGDRPATVAIDGRSLGEIGVDDAVIATASPVPGRLLTFGDLNFHAVLKAKFGLEDR
ncbi:MAG: NAD(+)/NADH kinase [Acidimicrobiales bacterium]|nr:NAD(+)/NADH kinase [Acidimicrobiales bacterium]